MTEAYVSQLRSSHDAFVRRVQHERDILQSRAGFLRGGFSQNPSDAWSRSSGIEARPSKGREVAKESSSPRSFDYGMAAERRNLGGRGGWGLRTMEGLGTSLPAPASFERRRLMLDADLHPIEVKGRSEGTGTGRKVTFVEPVLVRDEEAGGSDEEDKDDDDQSGCLFGSSFWTPLLTIWVRRR
jgi:hypothetical protein